MEMDMSRIIQKRAFVRNDKGLVYCSKCGALLYQDFYNYNRHLYDCRFKPSDLGYKTINENEASAYAVRYEANKLYIYVLAMRLKPKAITYKGYKGAEWVIIFKAVLSTKKVAIKESGEGTLEDWVKKFEKMECLNEKEPAEIIKHVFNIPGYRSFESFLQLYKEGRYLQEEKIPEDKLAEILKEPKDELEYFQYATNEEIYNVYKCKLVTYNEEHFLLVRIYTSEGIGHCIVGENYFRTNHWVDMDVLLEDTSVFEISEDDLEIFDKANPKFLLKHFIDSGGTNLSYPLFIGFYDRTMELLAKADCWKLVKDYDKLLFNNKGFIKTEEKNLNGIMGLSAKVLKKIDKSALECENMLRTLFIIYNTNKDYITQRKRISSSLIQYFENNIITETEHAISAVIPSAKNISEKRKRLFMDYFENLGEEYSFFLDYLHMLRRLNYKIEYFPSNLREVHDRLWRESAQNYWRVDPRRFEEVVHSEEYLSLTTTHENECDFFKKSEYVILAPRGEDDMFLESENLSHCVRIYTRNVIEKRTKIYFLRKRDQPEKSLATIEVYKDQVFQLKAFANSKADSSAREFVRRWSKLKGLGINTQDVFG